MAAALPLKRPVKVGELVRRRLRELKRTPRELAEAVQVSGIYIADLVAGRRVPPAPGRMDVYAPMTKFLKLHRNDLPTCAKAERDGTTKSRRRPHADVREQMLALCTDPARAKALSRRLAKKDGVPRHHFARRDGTVRDSVMYSILATEWPDVRRHLELRLSRG